MLGFRTMALLSAVGLAADPPTALRVIRATPLSQSGPAAVITVTFDRPVFGSLDRVVNAKDVLEVTPSIPGVYDWRDPVTVRLRPANPLPPGTTYTVTVKPDFTALDGSRLAKPYQFAFRVSGPSVIGGMPAHAREPARFLPPAATFDIALSAPADPAAISKLAYIELAKTCSTPGIVRVQAGTPRPIPEDAPRQIRDAGGYDRDHANDPLRRVVTLTPVSPLPHACDGELVLPATIDAEGTGTYQRWPFSTYGDFELLGAACNEQGFCPTGPIGLTFSTPVRGADLLRHITVLPKVELSVSDTSDRRAEWTVWAKLKPRTGYLVEVDSLLKDSFGQRLIGNPRRAVATTGYGPDIRYAQGRSTIERVGPRTLAVTYVNVDSLVVLTAAIPDSLEAKFLSRSWYSWDEDWAALRPRAARRMFKVGAAKDHHGVYGIPFGAPNASRPKTPTLFAVKVTNAVLLKVRDKGAAPADNQPVALVQITDLGVHAKIGVEEGVVWVTGASDGKPRAGAAVVLHEATGRVLARGRTDPNGIARFTGLRRGAAKPAGGEGEEGSSANRDGYVEVLLGDDRALVGINEYDPDLNLWQFNVSSGYGTERLPAAAAVFTERGIYRPGDSVYLKAIVRTGNLGSLKVPARTDSVRLTFKDREEGTLRESTAALSSFGTLTAGLKLPADAPLGRYRVTLGLRRQGSWQEIAQADYKVAEYRPPEFLVDVTSDTVPRFAGDSVVATISARYLFGAPMARAAVSWSVRQRPIWSVAIPNTDGYYIGPAGWWWEESRRQGGTQVTESRTDSLDGTGHLTIRAPVSPVSEGRPSIASIEAVVTDVNRQNVFSSTSVTVHPASFYIGAKPGGSGYFWPAGTAQAVDLITVRPDGRRVAGVAIQGTVVRREWHQVRRETNGYAEIVGEWVSDTVARCAVRTTAAGGTCRFTPPSAGSYTIEFTAADERGRPAATGLYRWVTGPGWVPWNDESQFKMEVVPDRTNYEVGDTATVLFASPFTGAEAWVTVEREGLIEQRRVRITDGATTLKFPITEAYAPNAYVAILVARGRSAKPGPLDDPGRPTIRVGYAELRVHPERKRLAVSLAPNKTEYRPAETAKLGISVRERSGRGSRSEVTLWGVDEGVLSLTGYTTPDPLGLLYQPRGVGLRLASNLSTVAPQVTAGDKGRNPGGGGGEGAAEILRSRFRTTAFFLGSVLTDSAGNGQVAVKLPDNLTTFRVMAVAVTAGDRYGKGESPLLVTRPLLARAALPRFVRPGDKLLAGVVVNHRVGGTPLVLVTAQPTGISLIGEGKRAAPLEAGRGREIRFEFQAQAGDSATFRFDVTGGGDQDAVRLALPIKPASVPRSKTVAGVLFDTATTTIDLSDDVDPARSRVSLSLGASPLTLLERYAGDLEVYPYFCSEQVASVALPIVALFRARKQAGAAAVDTAYLRTQINRSVAMLSRRQRPDGGIGLWSAADWTSPWLTAHAGIVLLEAKAAGAAVQDTVLAGIAGYLTGALQSPPDLVRSVAVWESEVRARLAERVAIANFLSRAGQRNRAAENDLIREHALLTPEDAFTLAEIAARGGDRRTARQILEPFWRAVKVEGRRAVLPDSFTSRFYFTSTVRPAASLLVATLAIDSANALLGPLFETVVTQGRTRSPWWNTQDYASAVRAVDAWQRRFPPGQRRTVRLGSGGRPLLALDGRAVAATALPLTGLVAAKGSGPKTLPLSLAAVGAGAPAFYYVTVTEVPRDVPVRPDDHGIVVERWYEDQGGKAITTATEGDLVRVRLKVSVADERAFVVVDDPLPAGLEAIDLSLRTVGVPGPGAPDSAATESDDQESKYGRWEFGSWDSGWWTPFDHRELRDDRVVYFARVLWKGTYTVTYLTRATTPGTFIRPQAQAEEMYNRSVYGRSDAGTFVVKAKSP